MEEVKEQLVAIDIETTGLDKDKDHVLEVALVALDDNYRIRAGGWYHRVLKLPEVRDYRMPVEVVKMHTRNRLLEECTDPDALTLTTQEADGGLEAWAKTQGFAPRSIYLQGRNVDFDHGFMVAKFPRFARYLSYRKDDTGAVVRFLARLGVEVPQATNPGRHRAVPDCEFAISQIQALRARLEEVLAAGGHVYP